MPGDPFRHEAPVAVLGALEKRNTGLPVCTAADPVLRSVTLGRIVVAGAVLLLVLLAAWDLALPGFYSDELLQVVPALDLARGPLASAVGHGPPGGQIFLLGRVIPFMTMDYMGAVKQFAFLPVAWLFSTTLESIRLFSIGMAVLSLFTTYAFAQKALGPVIGAIGVLLLATDPCMVFIARVDYGSTTLTMLLLKGLALWQLTRWWTDGSAWALFFGCLALGIGVYDKADFTWVVVATAAAILLVAPRGLIMRLGWRERLVAGFGFVVGASPAIWFNLTWPPRTLAALASLAMRDDLASGGVSDRLAQRLQMLVNMLDGSQASMWVGDAVQTMSVVSVMLGGATLLVLLSCLRRDTRVAAGPTAFVLAYGAFVLFAAALTVGGFGLHHVILTYPFPHLTLAGGLGLVAGELRAWRRHLGLIVGRLFLGLGVLLPVGANVANVVTLSHRLEQVGGGGNWSDAIYRLHDFLMSEPERPVTVLDWGIHIPLAALSQGRLASSESFWPLIDPAAPADLLRQTLARVEYRYVLHTEGLTNFPAPRARFFTEVEKSQRRARLLSRVAGRDGRPVFEVYAVEGVDGQ